MDGAMSKAPVGLAVAGANINEFKLLRETVESVPVSRPRATLGA